MEKDLSQKYQQLYFRYLDLSATVIDDWWVDTNKHDLLPLDVY